MPARRLNTRNGVRTSAFQKPTTRIGRGRSNLTLNSVSFPFGRWHCAHSSRACPPCNGYALKACSFTVKVEGFHPFTVWQEAHSPPSGRLASCPPCGSGLWQSMHFWNTSGFLKSPPAWHCAQSTLACLPSRGNLVLEWSKRSLTACKEIFFHPLVLWHD